MNFYASTLKMRMEENYMHFCHFMHFLFLERYETRFKTANICEIYRDVATSECIFCKWFAWFRKVFFYLLDTECSINQYRILKDKSKKEQLCSNMQHDSVRVTHYPHSFFSLLTITAPPVTILPVPLV